MNKKQKTLLAVDAAVNLVLGASLLLFPVGLLEFLGVTGVSHHFYTSILGGVILGIGVGLLIELFGAARGIRETAGYLLETVSKRRRIGASLVVPVIFALISPSTVRALSCDGPFTVDYHYEASELVLVGTFQETWKDGGEVFTEVTVEELFKGEADQVVILRRRASSRIAGGAEYHVPEGQRWLLFLPGQAEWPAPCSGSGRLDGVPGRRREITEAWLDELREYANGDLSTLQEPWQFREGPDDRCSMRLVGVHDSSPEDSRNGFFMDVVFASSEANPFALFVAYLPRGLRYSNTSDSDQPVALIVDGEPIQLDPPRETLGAPRYWGLQASEAEFVLDRIANQGPASVQVSFDGGFVEEVSQHRFSSVHKAFQECRSRTWNSRALPRFR